MKIEMTFSKATKNTYVFVASGTPIPTLYIQKSQFSKQPTKITVTVEVNDV